MSRIFVTTDDLALRVEITQDPDTGECSAACDQCGGTDLVADPHERFTIADTIDVAESHATFCRNREV